MTYAQTERLSIGVVINIADIAEILPTGSYPDEVTLVMRSGVRYPAGSGYNKTRQQTLEYWRQRVESVKGGAA